MRIDIDTFIFCVQHGIYDDKEGYGFGSKDRVFPFCQIKCNVSELYINKADGIKYVLWYYN